MRDIAFSRTGETPLFGKLTVPLPSVRVSAETEERLRALAAEAELPFQEFHRRLLEIRAHGVDTVKKVVEARITVVAGKSQESWNN